MGTTARGHQNDGRAEEPVNVSANRLLTAISVEGFKSILEPRTISIGGLTVLAGPNSSGKSSILQPLLLMKQTLEAPFDPGPLLLFGDNIRFTSSDQFLSRRTRQGRSQRLSVTLAFGDLSSVAIRFRKRPGLPIDLRDLSWVDDDGTHRLRSGMSHDVILDQAGDEIRRFFDIMTRTESESSDDSESSITPRARIGRNRFMFNVYIDPFPFPFPIEASVTRRALEAIQAIIHLPGLRRNPERSYPVSAVGNRFPGTFDRYTASVIARWQADDSEELEALGEDLLSLGLTGSVEAFPVDETQVEVRVGRLRDKPSPMDMVSLADVGVGISQVLPVLVALRKAQTDQIVYLEQPEIHLHPRAQVELGTILARATARGVRVLVETHSSLLLLGIQSAVVEGVLNPELVQLHWFSRDARGVTQVTSAELDDHGAFGKWPADFDDVALRAYDRYLKAVESKDAIAP
jgi:hypothetical protein